MKGPEKIKASAVLGPKHHFWVLGLAWTIILAASLAWTTAQEKQATLEMARIQARVAYEKDMLYRRWNAGHGLVYVPVTKETQPDPYLSDLPERDITTSSGKRLTLMHPTYMTRQAYELAEKESGVYGHITSLRPLRPENAPDSWETAALQAFESGEKEVSSFQEINGREFMRLIRPLIIEKACLKCHAKQGYHEGQIRGGIKVSIPMEPLRAIEHKHVRLLAIGHGVIWLIGLAGIGLWTQRLRQSERRRKGAEEEVRKYSEHLENLVQERAGELRMANEKLQQDIAERQRAEEGLRESEEQLRDLSLRLLKAQETERRRISRELHDELGGTLAVLKLRLSYIARNLQNGQIELREECEENLRYLDQMIENVYRISHDLSPHLLENLGISAALRWLINHFIKNYNVAMQSDIIDIDNLFARDDQVILYRIVQEALANIGKHAQAKNASVVVQKHNDSLSLLVEDDGKGFNPHQAFMKDGTQMGLGLRTINERARLLGGSLDLWSQEGKGTRITLSIPIKRGAIHHDQLRKR